MKEETPRKESQFVIAALPVYLGMQGITLLLTFLETPLYLEIYRLERTLTANGWLGLWFFLTMIGLLITLLLFARPSWRSYLALKARLKLAAGYFIGVIAGLVTLGLRFLPVTSPVYFLSLGILALLTGAVYIVWVKRAQAAEVIFP